MTGNPKNISKAMDNTGATGAADGGKATAMPWGKPNANRAPPPQDGGRHPTSSKAGNRERKSPPEDIRHSKIKAIMDPYLAKYNNYINISEILTASNKRFTNLPTLPSYTTPTGSSCICWNTILGRCFKGRRCRYIKGHVQKADVMDEFAEAVTNCIGKGLLYYSNLSQGGSPDKKRSAPDRPADEA
jgi:hypothetical protein